jgi:hypothetical protein
MLDRAQEAQTTIVKLVAYCRANEWAGYDPYDALNSEAFAALPFLNSRVPRLVLTQALKRSPINIRRVALIPKTQNAKAIALFLSAFVKLSRIGLDRQEDLGEIMIKRLTVLRSRDIPYWCWGYSFPWQTRTVVVPAGAPNLVCTSFVANALLDAYEQRGDTRCLTMAVCAAEYLLNELYWADGLTAGFSYPVPTSRAQIHNSNFLGAALLCRTYKLTGDRRFLNPALKVARFSASMQHADGSWFYGNDRTQRWIDNFHTGYNLCALHSIGRDLGTTEFESCVRQGFAFYREHFFRPDCAPRYFQDRDYPIDVHCVAQSIITLLELQELDPTSVPLAQAVFRWAMTHMWDDRGFFYYRVHPFWTIRTSFMRWSQAWMLLAISRLLEQRAAVTPRHQTLRVRALA